MTAQGNYPAIVVAVTNPKTEVRQRFTIALLGISEVGPNGGNVRLIDLSRATFRTDYSVESDVRKWSFSSNMSGYGQIVVYPAACLCSCII